MTETKPALVGDPQIDRLARVGMWLAAAENDGKDPQSLGMKAALRLFFAQQLGLPPLAAAEISFVRGRLYPGAKLLRALAVRAGYRIERDPASNDKTCTAILLREATGEEVGRYTFTIEDAQRAKLVKADSAWQTHPARMLWARATKYLLDDYAPEVTLGLGEESELEEIQPAPADEPHVPVEPETGESEEDRIGRLRAHLLEVVTQADKDGRELPAGFDDWVDYSRAVAREKFGADSVANLSGDELAELVELIEGELVPF
jgi:hypothetical protein